MRLIGHYIRVFVRSHFKPINPLIAKRWARNTSVLYLLLGWTALGTVIYSAATNFDQIKGTPISRGELFTLEDVIERVGSEKNNVIRIKGFTGGIERTVVTMDEIKSKKQESEAKKSSENLQELE